MLRIMKASRFALLVTLLLAVIGLALILGDESGGPGQQQPTLHRGLSSDPESIDPHKARSVQAAEVLRDIGEGLVAYSATGELVGAAAESWSISDDGLTYTFNIRPEARWSNGDTVTAEHFVFSLRRLVDPATAAFYAQAVAVIVNAEAIIASQMAPADLGVDIADDGTLVITLERPTPYLLSLLTHPSTFPVHPGSIAEHGTTFTRPENLLSNGAYKLEAWEPGSVLKLIRNEQYWNNAETSIECTTACSRRSAMSLPSMTRVVVMIR